MLAQYSFVDVMVFIIYALILVISGWWVNRSVNSSRDFFLAGKQMPMWVVAISILATSQSAATFLGGPDQGYRGNLTYLATNIGAFIAAMIVARWLIPLFYARNASTVYQLLQQRFGEGLKQRAGCVYLFGRLFASGARLYIAAIASGVFKSSLSAASYSSIYFLNASTNESSTSLASKFCNFS